jgi:hypothetical protein
VRLLRNDGKNEDHPGHNLLAQLHLLLRVFHFNLCMNT